MVLDAFKYTNNEIHEIKTVKFSKWQNMQVPFVLVMGANT